MNNNIIIEVLNKIIGTNRIDFISGNILNVGTKECTLSNDRGSVYGVAIKFKDKETSQALFNFIKKNNKSSVKKAMNSTDWKTIGDNYYPLYWGKDINFGSRLYSHTKTLKSTGTIQLCQLKKLNNHEIIYGAIPCINYSEMEKQIKTEYPDILITNKASKT